MSERLGWLAGEQATSQQLLFPAVVQLAPGEYATLESASMSCRASGSILSRSEAMR